MPIWGCVSVLIALGHATFLYEIKWCAIKSYPLKTAVHFTDHMATIDCTIVKVSSGLRDLEPFFVEKFVFIHPYTTIERLVT